MLQVVSTHQLRSPCRKSLLPQQRSPCNEDPQCFTQGSMLPKSRTQQHKLAFSLFANYSLDVVDCAFKTLSTLYFLLLISYDTMITNASMWSSSLCLFICLLSSVDAVPLCCLFALHFYSCNHCALYYTGTDFLEDGLLIIIQSSILASCPISCPI